ncbi:MAG TPA: hypothetical protein VGB83_09520 [Actinomycetota bacterium]
MTRTTEAARRGLKATKALAFVVVLALPVIVNAGQALAAPNCNGVFSGQTPNDPIVKTADKSEVVAGDDVTYTIQWHSTGVATADVTDCFRVDDGSDDTLNALVEVFNEQADVANEGEDGSLQSYQFTITVPLSADLIGHSIQNRAKITHGSQESRSDVVSVDIIAPDEVCDDEIDNDLDGDIDEDCGEDTDGIDDTTEGDDDDSTVVEGSTETKVKGEVIRPSSGKGVAGTKSLATTGTKEDAAILGALLLAFGMILRTVRPRSPRAALALDGIGSTPVLRLARSVSVDIIEQRAGPRRMLRTRRRGRTVRQ